MDVDKLQQKADQTRQSWMAFFVNNGHMTILTLIGLVVGGAFSVAQMPIESEPEVKIPIGVVTTSYPGASPSDVEKLVTDELEDRLKNLDDLSELTSNSTEGVSSIVVEFNADADLTESIRELRDEVDSAQSDLPEEANDSVVTEIRADDRAIITFTMIGSVPMKDFKTYADELEDRIEGIKGVNKVEVNGLPSEEMQVLVQRQKLEGFGLSISNVVNAIRQNHIDFPVGSIRTDDLYYQTSLKAQFDTPEELEALVIASVNNQNVFLRDIAEVREVFAETSSETRLFTSDDGQYRSAIALGVFKKTGEDLVRMADEAKRIVEEFKEELPEGMDVIVTDDESERILEDITQLLNSAWQTVLIIAITLLLALGVREALAAAFSIPVLYLIAFIGLASIGETFNFLTFFALILSLGVVVDTSVVIIEGVYENMSKYGMKARDAALASLSTFRAPLISGTLTTIAAFLPLGLMTGIMGEYVKHIPITVNITLIASLFTALMILPAVAAWLLGGKGNGTEVAHNPPIMHKTFGVIGEWYGGHIDRILESKFLRRSWLIGMFVAFIFSGVLFATGIVKFNLFSSVDVNIFSVNIDAPEGTSLERTKEITEKVEAIVEETDHLVRFVTIYGNGASHKARINLTLTDPDERSVKSYEIAQKLRVQLRELTEAEILVEELSAGPPSGADIDIRLLGDDVRTLEEFAAVMQKQLASVPGTVDVTNNLELSPGEYHIRPRRDRLEFFGITTQQIGSILRTSVFGDDSVKINRSGDEVPIVVKLDYRDINCLNQATVRLLETRDEVTICRSNPEDIAALQNLLIVTPKGQVPLSELVDIQLQSAVTTIRHFDTRRIVNVKASVEEGYILADVLKALNAKLDTIEKPEDIEIQFGGENEDTAESMASLGRASILAMLLILTILVYQFKSFKQVFIILMTMPLAVMGVLYGLAVIRIPLSFPGMIGMVALLGIVVNDAIVLIDRINTNRHEFGLPLIEAVKAGCKQRLEPVIMTTVTTSLGVVPLIFSGETFRDLAIVVSIGIVIATIFTLVVVPILYVALEKGIHPFRALLSGIQWLWRRIRRKNNHDDDQNDQNNHPDELSERARRVNLMQEGL